MALQLEPAGEEQLFLPHLVCIDDPPLVTPSADVLHGPNPLPHFPLPSYVPVPRETKFKPLIRPCDVSTLPSSHTELANDVKSLVQSGDELLTLKRSPGLNDALFLYADPKGPGVEGDTDARRQFLERFSAKVRFEVNSLTTAAPRETPAQQARRGPLQDISLHSFPFANANQQYRVACKMAGWLMWHAGSGPQPVENESAVQDQLLLQVFRPLEMVLRARYEANNNHAVDSKSGRKIPYPRFARPISQWHIKSGTGTGKVKSRAGFPDHILLGKAPTRGLGRDPTGLDRLRHLVIEVKAKWSYGSSVFEQMGHAKGLNEPQDLGGPDIQRRFRWGHNTLVVKLLTQIWGEVHFFDCNWGVATNGSKIVLFARTKKRELTMGIPVDLEDPRLLQILAGHCFASIDETKREGLAQFLCGESEDTWDDSP